MECDCLDKECDKWHPKQYPNYCSKRELSTGYICTRNIGHKGEHIAHGSNGITISRWSNTNDWNVAVDHIANGTVISRKEYGNECPCGIHPSQCEYHRESP